MNIPLDVNTLEFVMRRQAELQAREFWSNPEDLSQLARLDEAVIMARSMPFKVNLWQVQNLCARKLNGNFGSMRAQAEQGNEAAKSWMGHITSLAQNLDLRLAE